MKDDLKPKSRPNQVMPGTPVRPMTPDDVNHSPNAPWKTGTPRPFQPVHTFKGSLGIGRTPKLTKD